MEPPMKVTLVSGLVAWQRTPERGAHKHIQMRITCAQWHVGTVHACKITAPTLVKIRADCHDELLRVHET